MNILRKEKGKDKGQMHITAHITGIKYQTFCTAKLKEIDFTNFDINSRITYFIIKDKNYSFSISKWKSPKRTRSYPFERVYNTLGFNKKITVIPVIKDEGKDGDRDYVQWDTVSLMSLLDVFVIFAYYDKAEKNPRYKNKATSFEFDNNFVKNKIIEISNYHSSPLHWNLKEIKESLPDILDKTIKSIKCLSSKLSINFHGEDGVLQFKEKFLEGLDEFMNASRLRAKDAQNREFKTIQPKEYLGSSTKATITIKNYLGGLYYLTTDEVEIKEDILYLIEGKHSRNAKLPSIGDIKDCLLKMILYCNLSDVKVDNKSYKVQPTLKLTSELLISNYNSKTGSSIEEFCKINGIKTNLMKFLKLLLQEAKTNDIDIIIESAK